MKSKELPLRYKYTIGKIGFAAILLSVVLTSAFTAWATLVGFPDKFIPLSLAVISTIATATLSELRKKGEKFITDKELKTAKEVLQNRESQLSNLYSRPIWKLKQELYPYEINSTLHGYIEKMADATHSALAESHNPTWEFRVAVYELSKAVLETDDGNDSTETSDEDYILTRVAWSGRRSKPRKHFKKSTPLGKYTIDRLLDNKLEPKERELFFPNLIKNPIPGFTPEEFKNKAYSGFYAVPIWESEDNEVIGMLSIDCSESDCLTEEIRPITRHFADMLSLGLFRDVEVGTSKIITKPSNL